MLFACCNSFIFSQEAPPRDCGLIELPTSAQEGIEPVDFSPIERWREWIAKEESAQVRVVLHTEAGNPVIYDVLYKKKKYILTVDSTQNPDRNSSEPPIITYTFDYFHILSPGVYGDMKLEYWLSNFAAPEKELLQKGADSWLIAWEKYPPPTDCGVVQLPMAGENPQVDFTSLDRLIEMSKQGESARAVISLRTDGGYPITYDLVYRNDKYILKVDNTQNPDRNSTEPPIITYTFDYLHLRSPGVYGDMKREYWLSNLQAPEKEQLQKGEDSWLIAWEKNGV